MEPLKIYHSVNPDQVDINFRISRMEDIYDENDAAPDEPHRHDYYTILIVQKGNGIHKVEFKEYPIEGEEIFFVAPGQVHQVIENEKSLGYILVFSTQFLLNNSIPLSFIEGLNLFNNYGDSPPLKLKKDQFKKILNLAENIFELYNSEAKMKYLSIGSFLKLILIECYNRCDLYPMGFKDEAPSDGIIRKFKSLVEEHYEKEHSVQFYADKLFITSDHLSRTIKSKMGQTAKSYIQTRIIAEAKRLLYFSELTNKEISYTLGYNIPANFSNFFKNNTGMSPSEFRETERKI